MSRDLDEHQLIDCRALSGYVACTHMAVVIDVLSLLDWPLPRLAVNIICAHLRPATAGSFARYCLSELGFEVLLQGPWMVQSISI
jgi:hypothetical protein